MSPYQDQRLIVFADGRTETQLFSQSQILSGADYANTGRCALICVVLPFKARPQRNVVF